MHPIIGNGRSTIFHTPEGGIAIQFINKTGAVSKKGTVVECSSTTFNAAGIVPADEADAMGIVYDNGIADGVLMWVVTGGKAQVLLEDGTATTFDNWVRVSPNDAGRADGALTEPPSGGQVQTDNHFKEIGHSLEDVSAGTDKLALCLVHFN